MEGTRRRPGLRQRPGGHRHRLRRHRGRPGPERAGSPGGTPARHGTAAPADRPAGPGHPRARSRARSRPRLRPRLRLRRQRLDPHPARSPAAPPAPPAPPAAPPAPPAPPKVTLDKGRVNLVKGGSVSLEKNGKPFLSAVRMGLGWEPAHRGRNIDLDASCIAFDAQRKKVETAWFMKLSVFNGAIQHSGDNLTGKGDGDDEQITVHLDGLPPQVCGLVFTVNSFSGQKFSEIAKAYCRLVDATTGQELARFDLTHAEPRTGVFMCKLVRQFSGEWVMTALGEYADAKTARKMVEPAAALL
ncbi:hypothetical protein C7M71_023690 [Peterkaempfera bronchialis]|uniref:TerD domain-containing protein n=1 Tax=Peterkaempfera bronchialis TaxID=2126346 RepID=A0A345T1V0_9ACTN|nr:hypothetical protein C7M71_023690 [Peterkaempfera bronchialis]